MLLLTVFFRRQGSFTTTELADTVYKLLTRCLLNKNLKLSFNKIAKQLNKKLCIQPII